MDDGATKPGGECSGKESSRWDESPHLCRTVVGDGTAVRDGQGASMIFKKHRTVVVRTSDGLGIRTKRGHVVFKKSTGGTETVLHAARTSVMEGSVKELMAFRRLHAKTVRKKSYGRVRTQLILESRGSVGLERSEDEDGKTATVVNLDEEDGKTGNDEGNGQGGGRSLRNRKVRRRRKRRGSSTGDQLKAVEMGPA